ncbi:MAG: hypothetical protein KDC70_00080 [Saprospiraceae bacterium]|nr:hypothetical protein [Saprospiraceae bacterium]
MAERLEIHPTYVSEILRKKVITETIRQKASDLFGVPVEIFDTSLPIQKIVDAAANYREPESDEERELKAQIDRVIAQNLKLLDKLEEEKSIQADLARSVRQLLERK